MEVTHPLKIANYRNFIFTRFFLTLAYQIIAVIIGWHIYKLTGDVLALGLIGLAEALPAISIALFAHINGGGLRNLVVGLDCREFDFGWVQLGC